MKLSLVVLVAALLLSAVLSVTSFGWRQQSEEQLGEFAQTPWTYLNFCVPLNGGCLEQKDMANKPEALFVGSIQKIGEGAVRTWANVTNITTTAEEEANATSAEEAKECNLNRVGLAFDKGILEKTPMFGVSWYLNLPAEIFNESIIDHATVDWYPAESAIDTNVAKSKLYEDTEYFGFKFWFLNESAKAEIQGQEAQCNEAVQLSSSLLAENYTFSNKCVEHIGAIFVPGDAVQNESLHLMNISINYALYGDMLAYVEVAVSKEYLIMLATPGNSDDTGSQSLQPPNKDALHQLPQFAGIFPQPAEQEQQDQQNSKGAFPQDFRVRFLSEDLIPGCSQYQMSLDSFAL